MESVLRKLRQLHQSIVYHDKYIDRYDAVSLASLDLNKPLPEQVYNLEFKGLRRLMKDLTDILNEGSIMHQTYIIKIQRQVEACAENLQRIKAHQVHSVIEPEALVETDETASEEESSNQRRRRTFSHSHTIEESLLVQDLRSHLKYAFESLNESVESKVIALRIVRELLEHYHQSIVEIATSNGVLKASAKAKVVIPDRVESALKHKVFVVNEEKELSEQVATLWADAVLGSSDHASLAERDLIQIIQHKKSATLPWTYFCKVGAICILLMWSISECYNNENLGQKIWQDPTFAVFMCFGDLLLLLLMWGVSMHVWRNAGIDFVRLLNLHQTEIGQVKAPVPLVLKSFSNAALIFLVTFIIFNKAMRAAAAGHINLASVHAIPVLLTLYFCFRFVNPFDTRKQWLYMLWKVVAAPFYPVDFCAGYVGDLLTSLVRVSIPFLFSLVYVGISAFAWLSNRMDWAVSTSDTWWTQNRVFTHGLVPFLTLCPLWIRLVQCLRRSVETGHRWPHFGNALKYTSAIVVISHGTFQPQLRHNPIWILSFVGATLFQFAWDVFQDWGILEITWANSVDIPLDRFEGKYHHHNSSGGSWLEKLCDIRIRMRTKRLLGPVWIYVAIMVFNLALRFAWTLTLLPADIEDENPSVYATFIRHVGPFIAAAEIVRRMAWGFFRLEYEQITLIRKISAEEFHADLQQTDVEVASEPRAKLSSFDSICSTAREEPGENGDREDSELLPPLYIDSDASSNAEDPYDWTQFMPRDWLDALYQTSSSSCVTSWDSKLRCIESFVFAGAVVFIVFVAAYPAFAK